MSPHEHFDEAAATATPTTYGVEMYVESRGAVRTFSFELTEAQAAALLADLESARWEPVRRRLRRWAAEGHVRVVYTRRTRAERRYRRLARSRGEADLP